MTAFPAVTILTTAFTASEEQSLAKVNVKMAQVSDLGHKSAGVFIAHVQQSATSSALHVHVVMAVLAADNLVSCFGTTTFGKAGYSAFFDEFRHKTIYGTLAWCILKSWISIHFFNDFIDGKSFFCVAFKELY